MAVFDDGGHILNLAPFGQPFGQSPVQHGHVHLAHQPKGPPNARGRKQARSIINHHLMPVAHAHSPHPRDELFGRGRHMRQGRSAVADFVNVKEPRAGDMGLGVFSLGVAPGCWQIPRGIKHPQIRVFQMGAKPARRHQGFWIIHHRTTPNFVGQVCPQLWPFAKP